MVNVDLSDNLSAKPATDKELELAVISRETDDGEAKSDDIGNPEGEGEGEGEAEAKVEVSLMREY